MGKHFSHLTPTQRTQIDAFRRAGMKVVDIAVAPRKGRVG